MSGFNLRTLAAIAPGALLAAAAALPGCDPFRPTYEGLTCDTAGDCPDSFACSEGICRSEAALCGDGVLDAWEKCDDGNRDEGDGCNATCAAASCYVPVTHATMAEGIADATCPTVYVHSGTHAAVLTLTRATTLVGVGAEPAILDGGAAGTVITVDSGVTAALRKLTVRNGRAAQGAGVLNSGTLALESVIVTENTAEADSPNGGGIANLGGTLTLTNTHVSKNQLSSSSTGGVTGPALNGAGIYSTGGIVRLDGGSVVESNRIIATIPGAVGRGAGISATTTALTLAAASFVRGNIIHLDGGTGRATANGGGLFINSGSLKVEGSSSVDGNSATARGTDAGGNTGAVARGGGLYSTNATVALDSAFLRDNRAVAQGSRATAASAGGGFVQGGTLLANAAAITGNTVSASGLTTGATTAIAAAGGLELETVSGTFTGSTISANGAAAGTESATAGSASVGGLQATIVGNSLQSLSLIRCTLDGNSATSLDGTGSIGGISLTLAGGTGTTLAVRLAESTVSNNLARGETGAQIGGIDVSSSGGDTTLNLFVINSTISGNRADAPTGVASVGALHTTASDGTARVNVTLASSTIAENSATGASSAVGGISLFRTGTTAVTTFTSQGSIIAGNTAAIDANCRATMASIASGGYNLFGALNTCTVAGITTGNLTGAAGLGPLATNGGPTRTHALLGASQAINAGNPAGCTDHLDLTLGTDQRGLPRSAGGRCDIGAFEAQ